MKKNYPRCHETGTPFLNWNLPCRRYASSSDDPKVHAFQRSVRRPFSEPTTLVTTKSSSRAAMVERIIVERLRASVAELEVARGTLPSRLPANKTHEWSVIDAFEREGNRYVLARQGGAVTSDPACLTRRECEVLSRAMLGHHNKLIAHDLGIAHATVRVLLARAAAKMGVHSRQEAIALFAAARAFPGAVELNT